MRLALSHQEGPAVPRLIHRAPGATLVRRAMSSYPLVRVLMCRLAASLLALGLAVASPSAAGEKGAAELEAQLDKKLAERHRRTVGLAQLHYASSNWQRAAALYETARRFRDDDQEVLARLVNIYRRQKADTKLIPVLEALLRIEPRSISWLRELGSCHFRLGQHDRAEATWRKVLALYPENHIVAVRYLAQTYSQHGLHGKAVALYRKAVADRPEDFDLRLRLADALAQAGKPLEALAATGDLNVAAGSVRRRMARTRSAAFGQLALPQPFQAAVSKLLDAGKPAAADLAWAIAEALERSGDRKRATELYRRVAAREPKSDRGKAAAAKARQLAPKPDH